MSGLSKSFQYMKTDAYLIYTSFFITKYSRQNVIIYSAFLSLDIRYKGGYYLLKMKHSIAKHYMYRVKIYFYKTTDYYLQLEN